MTDEELIAKMRGADPWTAPYFASEALSFAADRIEALPAVTVGVKPLVWFELERGQNGYGKWTAEGYTVRKIEGLFLLDFAGDSKSVWRFPTAAAAKAAAQSDYTARILAALEPAAPDPACLHMTADMAAACPRCNPSLIPVRWADPAAIRDDSPNRAYRVGYAAGRAAALREAADAINERGKREQEDFGLTRATQNFYRARDLVRALIKKGAADDRA